jgi:protein dithiol:quinone oxidoreductase
MTARQGNILGFLICAGLLAYAYYAQVYMHLEPCPLCIFQRVGVFAMAIAFLIPSLHDSTTLSVRRLYAALIGLTSLLTVLVAFRHVYIQSLPADKVPACGASLDFMMKIFSLGEVLTKVLTGSGECARITWRFLGLAMPAWVLISALVLGGFGLWVNLKPRAPELRF